MNIADKNGIVPSRELMVKLLAERDRHKARSEELLALLKRASKESSNVYYYNYEQMGAYGGIRGHEVPYSLMRTIRKTIRRVS